MRIDLHILNFLISFVISCYLPYKPTVNLSKKNIVMIVSIELLVWLRNVSLPKATPGPFLGIKTLKLTDAIYLIKIGITVIKVNQSRYPCLSVSQIIHFQGQPWSVHTRYSCQCLVTVSKGVLAMVTVIATVTTTTL